MDPDELPPSILVRAELSPGLLYTIAVPYTYTGEESLPLVLALHYGGHGTPYFGEGVLTGLVEPALRELGAIIVAPDCTGASWTDPQSVADAFTVLDHVIDGLNVDLERTLVTGYSMGGIGAWHFAAHHPERFRAAVVMAGWPAEGSLDVDWQVPLYAIHSRQDEIVPLEPTEAAVAELLSRGASVELVTISGITHYQTSRFVDPLQDAIPWILEAWAR
jgi:predicted peptidase